MPTRRKTPASVEAKLLADNMHACCICHGNNLHVQIHHIDGNPANSKPENLAVLCLNCHSKATGNEGLGKRFSEIEITEYKRRWQFQCAEASKARAATTRDEIPLAERHDVRELDSGDFCTLYSNPDLARIIGKTVGVNVEGYFGPDLLEQLVSGLDRTGKVRRTRPNTLDEYDPNLLIYEATDATKVIFPQAILKATVPSVEELAVWVADPDVKVLGSRSDYFDFAGTFLYLITQLYSDQGASSFYTGCSALQMISNIITGRPFIERGPGEPLGRGSYLHPTDKLKSMGGIVIDRRPIQTLYKCRYMSDEQCFNKEERVYRGHDLLAYPLLIRNSDEFFEHLARNIRRPPA